MRYGYQNRNRFIPAGAGNTYMTDFVNSQSAVYPRWRGEHCTVVLAGMVTRGLSPLARGTHFRRPALESKHRFIPAGAGNTCLMRLPTKAETVYPRWRGEHAIFVIHGENDGGLSPLARGTHLSHSRSPLTGRFIPAGAGNTARYV